MYSNSVRSIDLYKHITHTQKTYSCARRRSVCGLIRNIITILRGQNGLANIKVYLFIDFNILCMALQNQIWFSVLSRSNLSNLGHAIADLCPKTGHFNIRIMQYSLVGATWSISFHFFYIIDVITNWRWSAYRSLFACDARLLIVMNEMVFNVRLLNRYTS